MKKLMMLLNQKPQNRDFIVSQSPWEHLIQSDFLDMDDFNLLTSLIDYDPDCNKTIQCAKKPIGEHKFKNFNGPKNPTDAVFKELPKSKELLELLSMVEIKLLDNLKLLGGDPWDRETQAIDVQVQTLIQDKKISLHCDALSKILSTIVYTDSTDYGTFISDNCYNHIDECVEVDSIPNSALSFISIKDKTWHGYLSKNINSVIKPRTTFNFFIRGSF